MDGGSGRAQLACAALILAALAATLALSGPGGATTRSPEEPAEPLSAAELERISVEALPGVAAGVERVRELEFDRLPEPEVVTSEFLNRLGQRQLERQGDLGIAADNALGAITGLLAPDEDLGAALDSTGDLAAAAYDPHSERLFVVSDAVGGGEALVEFVLAHELDHALEDQAFGLREGRNLTDDGALAAQALVEGSATAVMTDYAVRYLNPFDLIAAAGTIDDGTDAVPDALVEQLTWTYIGGERFVSELVELAGSWKLVDNALATRPPATTEQILHPRKYVLDERPADLAVDGDELERRGWRRADRNDFGEFGTSQLLEVGVDEQVAREAAAGWDGDRYELWRQDVSPADCRYPCRADLVLVARWRLDGEADAAELASALAEYLGDGLAGEPAGDGVWTLDGGYAATAAGSREVAVVFAPKPALAEAVAAAQVGD